MDDDDYDDAEYLFTNHEEDKFVDTVKGSKQSTEYEVNRTVKMVAEGLNHSYVNSDTKTERIQQTKTRLESP